MTRLPPLTVTIPSALSDVTSWNSETHQGNLRVGLALAESLELLPVSHLDSVSSVQGVTGYSKRDRELFCASITRQR